MAPSSIIWLVGQFFLPQSNRTRRDHNRGFVPGVRSFATSFADLESCWPHSGGSSIPQLPSNLLPAFLPSWQKAPAVLGQHPQLAKFLRGFNKLDKGRRVFSQNRHYCSTLDVVFYATSAKTSVCTNQSFFYSQTCQALYLSIVMSYSKSQHR